MGDLGVNTSHPTADAVMLSLSGELDIATSGEIERELASVESAAPMTLVLDLSNLEFLDSTGLRLILSAHERAKAQGRRLLLIEGPDPVQRVFDLTQLSSRLPFIKDVSELHSDS